MGEFVTLAWQLLGIAILQFIFEVIIDPKERPYHVKILNIACVMASMYLLLQFASDFLLNEISAFITFPF